MSAQSPRLAICGEVARLPLPPLDIEPVSTLFTRHLPPERPATTHDIECASIRADYVRMLCRAREAVAQLGVHLNFLTLEALCLACIDPAQARPYVAQVGHIAFAVEQLVLPENSAVDPSRSRVFR
jgi:hypothetical protein